MSYTPIGSNAGAVIYTTSGPTAHTICCDHWEFDDNCNIIEAPSFCSTPYVPHVPGLIRGRATISGTWDSAFNPFSSSMKVGAVGILELDINGAIKSVSQNAIVESYNIVEDVDGKPTYIITFIYDGSFNDFANSAA